MSFSASLNTASALQAFFPKSPTFDIVHINKLNIIYNYTDTIYVQSGNRINRLARFLPYQTQQYPTKKTS